MNFLIIQNIPVSALIYSRRCMGTRYIEMFKYLHTSCRVNLSIVGPEGTRRNHFYTYGLYSVYFHNIYDDDDNDDDGN